MQSILICRMHCGCAWQYISISSTQIGRTRKKRNDVKVTLSIHPCWYSLSFYYCIIILICTWFFYLHYYITLKWCVILWHLYIFCLTFLVCLTFSCSVPYPPHPCLLYPHPHYNRPPSVLYCSVLSHSILSYPFLFYSIFSYPLLYNPHYLFPPIPSSSLPSPPLLSPPLPFNPLLLSSHSSLSPSLYTLSIHHSSPPASIGGVSQRRVANAVVHVDPLGSSQNYGISLIFVTIEKPYWWEMLLLLLLQYFKMEY